MADARLRNMKFDVLSDKAWRVLRSREWDAL